MGGGEGQGLPPNPYLILVSGRRLGCQKLVSIPFPHMLFLVWQAAADFKASADISKDHEDDEDTDQSQAQELEQDDSEDDDNHEGKRTL